MKQFDDYQKSQESTECDSLIGSATQREGDGVLKPRIHLFNNQCLGFFVHENVPTSEKGENLPWKYRMHFKDNV